MVTTVVDAWHAPMSDARPTTEEVKHAVHALENGISPGQDKFIAEAIKTGGNIFLSRLHGLIQ